VGSLSATNYNFRFATGTLVITQAVPLVTVTSLLNPSGAGLSTSFRVSVSPGGTGSVTLYDGGVYLAVSNLNGTSATVTVRSLSVGSHSITAVVRGANYLATTSAAIVQTVH
jgi:hypothetical protein